MAFDCGKRFRQLSAASRLALLREEMNRIACQLAQAGAA
jgi:hypothetical protein